MPRPLWEAGRRPPQGRCQISSVLAFLPYCSLSDVTFSSLVRRVRASLPHRKCPSAPCHLG